MSRSGLTEVRMENDCPCCQRKIKVAPIQEKCEYCDYEFTPQLPAEVVKRRSSTRAFAYTLIGAALLVTVYHAPNLYVRYKMNHRDALKGLEDSIHQIQNTSERGQDKSLVWGRLFDVRTLEPVRKATIVYQDPKTGTYYGAFTDDEGLYRAWLPAADHGFYVSIHHPYYAPAYMSDWTPSLTTLKSDAREDVAENLLRQPQTEEWIITKPGAHFNKDYALSSKIIRKR